VVGLGTATGVIVTAGSETATLVWAHRGVGTDLWLRVDSPRAGQLVARSAHVADVLELGELAAGTNDLTVQPPDELAPAGDEPETWTLAVREDADRSLPVVVAGRTSTGFGELVTCLDGQPATLRLRTDGTDHATLTVRRRQPWAEVRELVEVAGELRVRAKVIGDAHPRDAWFVERDGDVRTPASLEVEGDELVVRAPLAPFLPGEAPRHHSLVLDTDGGPLRLGRHLDGIPNKGRAFVPRPVLRREDGAWWTVTPRFTDRNNVVVTVSPRTVGPRPDPREAWELDPADLAEVDQAEGGRGVPGRQRWLHRFASMAFALVARSGRRSRPTGDRPAGDRPTGDRPTEDRPARRQVHLLIASIHAMGGTIRATINTANALAADPDLDVSLTVVYRLKEQQFFPIDPRVRTTVLVDEPWLATQPTTGFRAWFRGLALDTPSALVPEDDPRYYRFSLWHDLQLLRWLRTLEHGTVVTTRAGLSVVAARFARPGVRIVAQQHVPFATQTPELRRSLVDSYRKVDAVTVLTAGDEEEVRRDLGGTGTLVRRIPNALFDLEPPRSPLTEPRILCGGRFTPAKGMDLLIDAFARIAAQRPEWELRIYGSARPDRLEALREMVRRHGLEDRVLLMAPTDHLELEMSKASVCAVPSRHEAFGMMIIEAMRCGLPVVAFDCPVGPGEIITDGHDGLLVPPEDVGALAERLLQVTGDQALRAQLAEHGLETARRYAPQRVAGQLLELLDEVERR
jgi:glycosyltransferase involved in cell wall biosynthesis